MFWYAQATAQTSQSPKYGRTCQQTGGMQGLQPLMLGSDWAMAVKWGLVAEIDFFTHGLGWHGDWRMSSPQQNLL